MLFAREGAKVAVVDLREDAAKATAESFRQIVELSPLLPDELENPPHGEERCRRGADERREEEHP